MDALLAGHVQTFFASVPGNGSGGSILMRAPFTELSRLAGGSSLAVYRFDSLFCLLVLAGTGIALAAAARRRGVSEIVCLGVVILFACSPSLLEPIFLGHPEEVLGAALAVGAVSCAGAGRSGASGLLLGAALINKPWGVFLIGPVLLCAPGRRRAAAGAAAVVGGWALVSLAAAPSALLRTFTAAGQAVSAHPQDLWWPLARPHGGTFLAPALVAGHARELAIVAALGAAGWLAVRRPSLSASAALALLAFGFALRNLLEPSAHDYYQLPLLCAVTAWELRAHGRVTGSLGLAIGLAVAFDQVATVPATLAWLLYLACTLPLLGLLGAAAFAGPAPSPARPTLGRCRRRSPAWSR